MSRTPLALLKQQLRLDTAEEDALLQHKIDCAEQWISNHVGAPLPDPAPATIIEAALLLASFWFEQREAALLGTSAQPIPFGVHGLLESYREQVTGHVAQ